MKTIAENMGALGISIGHAQIAAMERTVVHWELRGTHPLTLDGPYLGVDPIAFKTSDSNALFDIFHVHKRDVDEKIRQSPSINRSWVVTSDAFNILSMWLVHLAPIYIKDRKVCYAFQTNVLKYLLYKFFSSKVNNSFRHGTNYGVMVATLNELKLKSDIVRYESWKRLIESHVTRILDPDDRYYATVLSASPDEAFLRLISDNQTSLGNKIVLIAQKYYETHRDGGSVKTSTSVGENDEGEKIVAQLSSVIDSATSAMVSEVLSPGAFISESAITDVQHLSTSVSRNSLRQALLKLNEAAVIQAASRKFDLVEERKDGTVYVGIRHLMKEIIRSMVKLAKDRRINMANQGKLFRELKDAYTSSRNTDPDIAIIKRSMGLLIDDFGISSNAATQASLRLSVIYYILYRTLLKMKT